MEQLCSIGFKQNFIILTMGVISTVEWMCEPFLPTSTLWLLTGALASLGVVEGAVEDTGVRMA
jgi:hypothetical protein